MKIKLNGEEYKLNFGIGFIHEVDKIYNQEIGGVQYGLGVSTIYSKLQGENPYDLFITIKSALKDEYDFTEGDFDNWVESFESDKEYAGFIKELLKTLEVQRVTGKTIKTFKKNMKELEKQAQEELQTSNNNTEK